MNKFLNPYVNEIIAIAGANNVSWDVGSNMFLTNIKNVDVAGAPYYEGADVDYGKLADELGPIDSETERDMLQTFRDCYEEHMAEVIALRKEGKYAEAAMIMVRA